MKPCLHTSLSPGGSCEFGNYWTGSAFLTLQTITRHSVKMQILIRQTQEERSGLHIQQGPRWCWCCWSTALELQGQLELLCSLQSCSLKVSGRKNTQTLACCLDLCGPSTETPSMTGSAFSHLALITFDCPEEGNHISLISLCILIQHKLYSLINLGCQF